MEIEGYFSTRVIFESHGVTTELLSDFQHLGLLEFHAEYGTAYIHQSSVSTLEKMIRVQHELTLNADEFLLVFPLILKIQELQAENQRLRIGLVS